MSITYRRFASVSGAGMRNDPWDDKPPPPRRGGPCGRRIPPPHGCLVDIEDRREWRTQARRGGAATAPGVKPLLRPGIFACPNPTGLPSQAVDEGLCMRTHTRVPTVLSRAGAVSALALAAVGGMVLTPGATSEVEAASLSHTALRIAASKKGSPYQYGAAGPYRFDCSGLTMYSFKRAGKQLPRTAASQYNHSRRIGASSRRPGDLVFFHSGGRVYHVGIYAGSGRIWHSPKTGTVVRLEKIWTSSVRYGRVN